MGIVTLKLEDLSADEKRRGGGSAGIVITSDKHTVVFNYQVFTLLRRTSISRTPKNLTHTVAPRY